MKYRQIGKWGVRLSCLGIGSYLTFGLKVDDETTKEIIKVAYENGINFIDTSNAYANGAAEEALGRCLSNFSRSSLFILTKAFYPMGLGPNDRGLSAKHIKEQCEASLRRLKMEYIDVYMCHRPDSKTPLEETIRALEDLTRQGKILYWGVSEWMPDQIVKAQSVAKEVGARPMIINEPRYSLLYRYPDLDIFPTTLAEGIGNVNFSPLAHGMLTGKYLPGKSAPKGTRAADLDINEDIMGLYWTEENKQKGQELAKIANDLGVSAVQLAITWCLKHPAITSVILGIRTVEQMKENLKAVDIDITEDLMEVLDKLYPAPKKRPAAPTG